MSKTDVKGVVGPCKPQSVASLYYPKIVETGHRFGIASAMLYYIFAGSWATRYTSVHSLSQGFVLGGGITETSAHRNVYNVALKK